MLLPGAQALELEGPLAHFAEHGYARLGKVMNEAGLAALRERTDDLMLGRVVYPGMFFQHDAERYRDLEYGKGYIGPSLSYRKLEKLEKDPLFLSWIQNPLFERIARALIPGGVAIYRATLFNKSSEGSSELPWHQDGGIHWGLSEPATLQIWTAFDDAPMGAGCVELIPGSHKEGLATPLGGLIPEEVALRANADARRVAVPVEAGEALLIHNYLWHCSGKNTSGRARRALTVCYMSAETRCLRKKRAPREFFRVFG